MGFRSPMKNEIRNFESMCEDSVKVIIKIVQKFGLDVGNLNKMTRKDWCVIRKGIPKYEK
jgi:hypothetical protein